MGAGATVGVRVGTVWFRGAADVGDQAAPGARQISNARIGNARQSLRGIILTITGFGLMWRHPRTDYSDTASRGGCWWWQPPLEAENPTPGDRYGAGKNFGSQAIAYA